MERDKLKPSLDQLQAQQEKLSTIIGQRQNVVNALSEREKIEGSPLDLGQIRQIAVKNRVLASINRYRSLIEETEQQIDEYLPTIAQNYQVEVQRKERDLRQVIAARNKGLISLPEETVILYQQEVNELKDKPSRDLLLARALNLPVTPETPTPPTREDRKDEAEKQPKKIASTDTDKKEIAFEGRKIRFRSHNTVGWGLLVYFARVNDPNRTYTVEELNEITTLLGATGIKSGSNTYSNIKKTFGEPENPRIFLTEGRRKTPLYRVNAQFEGFEDVKNETVDELLKKPTPILIEGVEKPADPILNQIEIGILAALVQNLDLIAGLPQEELTVEPGVLEACRKVFQRIPLLSEEERQKVAKEYLSLRGSILEKVRLIVNSDNIDSDLDAYDDDTKLILIWMWNQNSEGHISEIIRRMLTKTNAQIQQTETILLQKFEEHLQTTYYQPTQPLQNPRQPQVGPSAVEESDHIALARQFLEQQRKQEQERVKMTEIERMNPTLRTRINEYFDLMDSNHITEPVYDPNISRVFRRIKLEFLEWMIDKKLIKPAVGRDGHHMMYSPEDIALILYVYDHQHVIDFKPRTAKDLSDIIEQTKNERDKTKKQNLPAGPK